MGRLVFTFSISSVSQGRGRSSSIWEAVVVDPLSVLGLAAPAISAVRKLIRGNVVLQPKKLSFGGSEWEQVWALNMTSLADLPLYNVVVGIWSDDRPVVTDLPIELVALDGTPVGPMVQGAAGVEMDAGCVVMRGRAGVTGVMLVFVQVLAPRQTVRLGIKGQVGRRFHVFTEVLEYVKEGGPLSAVGPDGNPAVRVHLPIDMTVSGLSSYLRRTGGEAPP
jgi:hypothetical protein